MGGLILNPYRFGASGAEIDRTLGTILGDMTFGGTQANAFDGTTSQLNGSCARKTATTAAYIGRTGDVARRISKGTIHGANDTSEFFGGNNVTITLYAKTGAAPANGTDGTSLGTYNYVVNGVSAAPGYDIISSDPSTLWDHWWFYLLSAGSTTGHCAEARFFE